MSKVKAVAAAKAKVVAKPKKKVLPAKVKKAKNIDGNAKRRIAARKAAKPATDEQLIENAAEAIIEEDGDLGEDDFFADTEEEADGQ